QETDLDVVVEDRFGNRLTKWKGTIAVEVPQDRSAALPAPVTLTAASQGHGVLHGLLVAHAGPTAVVFKDERGSVVSQANEGVTVAKSPIRPWLGTRSASASGLFAADPTASATGDGSVAGELLLRRFDGGDAFTLPSRDLKD